MTRNLTPEQRHKLDNLGARLESAPTRRLIESFQPPADDVVAPQCKVDTINLIDRAPSLFCNRYNYYAGIDGHITSQAYIWNPDLRKIALLNHKQFHLWMSAGGHVEPGDTDIIATARREAAEEMGLTELELLQDTPFDIDIHGYPERGEQPDHYHYDIRWLFQTHQTALKGEDLPPEQKKDKAKDPRWCTIAEARELMGMWLPNSRIIRGLEARFG